MARKRQKKELGKRLAEQGRIARGKGIGAKASLESATADNDVAAPLIASATNRADFVYVPSRNDAATGSSLSFIAHHSVFLDKKNGRSILQLSGGIADAPSHGITGGYSIRVPDAFEMQASGRNIMVRVVARAEAGASMAHFAIAYSTCDVGNSGWRWFDVSPEWAIFELPYSVPQMKNGNGDFIGLLPAPAPNSGVEICAVAAFVV